MPYYENIGSLVYLKSLFTKSINTSRISSNLSSQSSSSGNLSRSSSYDVNLRNNRNIQLKPAAIKNRSASTGKADKFPTDQKPQINTNTTTPNNNNKTNVSKNDQVNLVQKSSDLGPLAKEIVFDFTESSSVQENQSVDSFDLIETPSRNREKDLVKKTPVNLPSLDRLMISLEEFNALKKKQINQQQKNHLKTNNEFDQVYSQFNVQKVQTKPPPPKLVLNTTYNNKSINTVKHRKSVTLKPPPMPKLVPKPSNENQNRAKSCHPHVMYKTDNDSNKCLTSCQIKKSQTPAPPLKLSILHQYGCNTLSEASNKLSPNQIDYIIKTDYLSELKMLYTKISVSLHQNMKRVYFFGDRFQVLDAKEKLRKDLDHYENLNRLRPATSIMTGVPAYNYSNNIYPLNQDARLNRQSIVATPYFLIERPLNNKSNNSSINNESSSKIKVVNNEKFNSFINSLLVKYN